MLAANKPVRHRTPPKNIFSTFLREMLASSLWQNGSGNIAVSSQQRCWLQPTGCRSSWPRVAFCVEVMVMFVFLLHRASNEDDHETSFVSCNLRLMQGCGREVHRLVYAQTDKGSTFKFVSNAVAAALTELAASFLSFAERHLYGKLSLHSRLKLRQFSWRAKYSFLRLHVRRGRLAPAVGRPLPLHPRQSASF